jgi:hypothetical protein
MPLVRDADDFETYVKNVLGEYQAVVDALPDSHPILTDIKSHRLIIRSVAEDVIATITAYLDGKHDVAGDRLGNAVKQLQPHLDKLSTADLSKEMDHLYRVRKSSTPLTSKAEMFHIPLDKRHLVAPQRYSIPGVPCLYLGGSLYLCWEELGQPDVELLHMSHFKLRTGQTVKLLNLVLRPEHVAAFIEWQWDKYPDRRGWLSDYAVSTGVCWPLVAISSVRVKHRESPFKPEYIVPQLLLQRVITSTDLDGICYSSTNVQLHCPDTVAIANFVFPVKSGGRSGACPGLTAKFEMTDPVAWRAADLVMIPGGSLRSFPCVIGGIKSDYRDTKFCEMEYKVCEQPHSQL